MSSMRMPVKNRRFRAFGRATLVVSCLMVSAFVVSGCDLAKNQLKMDRSTNMEFQDYRDALAPRASDRDRGLGSADDGIPELQPYVAQPSDNLRPMPLVSISVNQTVPLRDALFELANQAGYDIELDPHIRGSIIFTARQRPLDVVVERIADIAGLRYKFEGDTIRVEVDRPYHQTYKIDYLNYIRKNQSSIRNDVSVVTGDGASTSTGSGFQAQSESEADFWGELNSGLTQIVGVNPNVPGLRTDADPQITAAAQNPTSAPVEPVVTIGPDGETIVQAQAPQATLQVQSLPTDVNGSGDASSGTRSTADVPTFSLNRQAGIVSVYAPSRTHDRVSKYLELLRLSVTSQVLIEAKVLEVSLTDEFAAGIDWMAMNLPEKGRFGFDVIGDNLYPSLNTPQEPQANFVASIMGSDFNAAVQAISRFGTVHALASPRLTVLNNQSAALSVANNLVYFEIDIDVTRDEFGTQTQIDSSIRNVPEGVLINVQPSIDLNRQTISMSLRPTITRVIDYVPDPAVTLAVAQAGLNTNISSQIPVVNVQEFDSVINLESGQTMVLGGLLQDRTTSTQQGVPVLSEVPLLGGLFRTQGDEIRKTELVVFLKATILDGASQSIHTTDRDLYKRFSGDRRPLNF